MAHGYAFETTCTDADPGDLERMWESAREIDYRRFASALDAETIREFEESVPPLSREPHATFHEGEFRGRPVIVLTHSQINHLWTR